jgi:methionyl-tRNA formyltransferase
MWLAEELPLAPRTTLPELHDAVAAAAARALERFLGTWPPPEPTPQDERRVTLCRKLTAEDGHLDFARPGAELERWVRAYTPVPGCWTLMGGERLRVLALEPRPTATLASGGIAGVGGELLVGCADGGVALTRVQPAGGRVMTAPEFLNGHRIPDRVG